MQALRLFFFFLSLLISFFFLLLLTSLVPVIAFGFDDLRERANAQSTQSSSHLQKLTDLSSRLKSLLTEHSISNASRLQRAHNAQTQLTQRLMRLVQHLHLLIPAVRSSSIRVEEEELRGKLEEMEEELKRSRVKGKLNELWALLGAVGAFMERGRGDGQGGQGGWAVVDDEGLAQITQVRFLKIISGSMIMLTCVCVCRLADLGGTTSRPTTSNENPTERSKGSCYHHG